MGRGSTDKIVSEVPSPNDATAEEGQNENDTVDKLKPRTRQIDFVLQSETFMGDHTENQWRFKNGVEASKNNTAGP